MFGQVLLKYWGYSRVNMSFYMCNFCRTCTIRFRSLREHVILVELNTSLSSIERTYDSIFFAEFILPFPRSPAQGSRSHVRSIYRGTTVKQQNRICGKLQSKNKRFTHGVAHSRRGRKPHFLLQKNASMYTAHFKKR